MPFNFSETAKAVQEYLNAINVKYGFNYIGAVDSKEWAHDLFTVSFIATGKEPAVTEYKTGTGHRIEAKFGKFDLKTRAGIAAHRVALGVTGTRGNPTQFSVNRSDTLFVPAPTAASVLYSLLSDAQCGSDTFEDFCRNMGYDEDSRKAHETYLACQKSGTQLRKAFTREQLEKLQELLQDY